MTTQRIIHSMKRPFFQQITAFMMMLLLSVCSIRAEDLHSSIETVQSRMVKLYGAGGLQNLAGYGTGFLVSSEGHIATAWSHVLDTDRITAVLSNGRRTNARVIATDFQNDLAMLKIEASDLPYFDLNQSTEAVPGTWVLAFSNMFNVAAGDEPLTVVHGVISSRTQLQARRGRYQTPYQGPVYIVDALVNNPGAAGGVLTTETGELLAMLGREVQGQHNNTWINYAIPILEVRESLVAMLEDRFRESDPLESETARSQQRLTAIDFGIALVPDVVQRTPAFIEHIIEGSSAFEQGLKADDLVVMANGEVVNSRRNLEAILNNMSAGDELTIVVRRDTNLISVVLQPSPK